MVLAFAALNESPERGSQQEDAAGTESLEAQEVRVYSTYEDALRFIQDGETSQAQELLEGLLDDPILEVPTGGAKGQQHTRGTALGAQLRFLVLKNLAALLAARDEDAPRALELYAQALSLDQEDIVVWNRMGTLAAELGMWGLSRAVFERGLACNARHPLLLEKLMEVVLHIGDWDAAAHLAARILHKDAFHPRARALSAFFAQQGVGNLPKTGVPGVPFSTTEMVGAEPCHQDAWRPQFPTRAIPTRVPGTPARDPSPLVIEAPTWKALAQALLGRLVQTLDAAPEGRYPAVGEAVQIVVNEPPLAPASAPLGPSVGLREIHTSDDVAQPLGEGGSRAGATGTTVLRGLEEAETGRTGQVSGAAAEEPGDQREGPGRNSGKEASSLGPQPMEGVEGPEILASANAATSDPRPEAEVDISNPGGAGKGETPASDPREDSGEVSGGEVSATAGDLGLPPKKRKRNAPAAASVAHGRGRKGWPARAPVEETQLENVEKKPRLASKQGEENGPTSKVRDDTRQGDNALAECTPTETPLTGEAAGQAGDSDRASAQKGAHGPECTATVDEKGVVLGLENAGGGAPGVVPGPENVGGGETGLGLGPDHVGGGEMVVVPENVEGGEKGLEEIAPPQAQGSGPSPEAASSGRRRTGRPAGSLNKKFPEPKRISRRIKEKRTRYTDDEGGEVAEQSPCNIIALLREYLGAPPYIIPPTPAALPAPPTPAAAGDKDYAMPSATAMEVMPVHLEQGKEVMPIHMEQGKEVMPVHLEQEKGVDAAPLVSHSSRGQGATIQEIDKKVGLAPQTLAVEGAGQLQDSEGDAVLRFLGEHTGREGLAAVSVALLEELSRDPGKKLPDGVPEVIMKLEEHLRGWERSARCALFLAELHADRALEPHRSKSGNSEGPSGTADSSRSAAALHRRGPKLSASSIPTGSTARAASAHPHPSTPLAARRALGDPATPATPNSRKGNAAERAAKHIRAAEANLALVLDHVLYAEDDGGLGGRTAGKGQSSGNTEEMEVGVRTAEGGQSSGGTEELELRYHWVLGRLAEHAGQHAVGAAHFRMCYLLCGGPLGDIEDPSRPPAAVALSRPAPTPLDAPPPPPADDPSRPGVPSSTLPPAAGVAPESGATGGEWPADVVGVHVMPEGSVPNTAHVPDPMDVDTIPTADGSHPGVEPFAEPQVGTTDLYSRASTQVIGGEEGPCPGTAARRSDSGGLEVAAAGRSDIEAAAAGGTAEVADSGGDNVFGPARVVRLANCRRDGEVSAAAAAEKLENFRLFRVLEEGRQRLEAGQAGDLVRDMAPLVLTHGAGRGATGPSRQRHAFMQALALLEVAAEKAGPEFLETELRARLLHMRYILPQSRPDSQDGAGHSARPHANPPAAVGDLIAACRPAMAQPLWELVGLLERLAGGRGKPQVEEMLAARQDEIHCLLWQLLVQVERCYWALTSASGKSHGHRSLNVKEANKQTALLASVMALCLAHQLDAKVSRDPSTVVGLLAGAAEILGERGALMLRRGAFVRMALLQLAGHMDHKHCTEPNRPNGQRDRGQNHRAGSDSSRAEAVDEDVQQEVDAALAQCLYLLYGVDLPHRNREWGGMFEGPEAGSRTLSTRAECLEAWQYVRPYALALQLDRRKLLRLQGVLDAMVREFPAPPAEVISAWDPIGFLDSPDFDITVLLQGPRPTVAQDLLASPPSLLEQVQADEHRDVHSALYLLQFLIQPDLDDIPSRKEGCWLEAAPEPALEEALRFAGYALRYQPSNYVIWDRLAGMYRKALELLLDDGAMTLSVAEWGSHPWADARRKTFTTRALRAMAICRQLAPADDDLAAQDEEMATIYYAALQATPPLFDSASEKARAEWRARPGYLTNCQRAKEAFERAAVVLPDEWYFVMHLGKLDAKQGAAPSQVLSTLARACHYAEVHNGGVLEPLYRLHATRLKMLTSAPQPLSDIARHCFLSETASSVAELGTAEKSVQKALLPATHPTELEPRTSNQQREEATEAPATLHSSPCPANGHIDAPLEDTSAPGHMVPHDEEVDVEIMDVQHTTLPETLPLSAGDLRMTDAGHPPDDTLPLSGGDLRMTDAGDQTFSEPSGRIDTGSGVGETPAADVAGDGVQSQLRQLLLNDCMEAMRWCLEKERHYHKARYRMARALEAEGDIEEAVAVMRHLFTHGRRAFALNVWQIPDRTDAKAQAGQAKQQRGESAESLTPEPAAGGDPEGAWGRRPARITGSGLMHSERKLLGALRKYIAFYTELLSRTGDLDTLQAVAQFMRAPEKWTHINTVTELGQAVLGKYASFLADVLRHAAADLFTISSPSAVSAFPSQVPVTNPETLRSAHPNAAASLPDHPPVTLLRHPSGESSAPRPAMQTSGIERPTSGLTLGRSYPLPQLRLRKPPERPEFTEAIRKLLEKAYALYAEFSLMPDGNATWAHVVQPALAVACSGNAGRSSDLAVWATEIAFREFARAHVVALGEAGDLERLGALQGSLRKRYKVLKMAPPAVGMFAGDLAMAVFQAAKLAVDRLEAESCQPPEPAAAAPASEAAKGGAPAENEEAADTEMSGVQQEADGEGHPAVTAEVTQEGSPDLSQAEDSSPDKAPGPGAHERTAEEGYSLRSSGAEVGAAGRSRRESFGRPRGPDVVLAAAASDPREAERERGFQVLRQVHQLHRTVTWPSHDAGLPQSTGVTTANVNDLLLRAFAAYMRLLHGPVADTRKWFVSDAVLALDDATRHVRRGPAKAPVIPLPPLPVIPPPPPPVIPLPPPSRAPTHSVPPLPPGPLTQLIQSTATPSLGAFQHLQPPAVTAGGGSTFPPRQPFAGAAALRQNPADGRTTESAPANTHVAPEAPTWPLARVNERALGEATVDHLGMPLLRVHPHNPMPAQQHAASHARNPVADGVPANPMPAQQVTASQARNPVADGVSGQHSTNPTPAQEDATAAAASTLAQLTAASPSGANPTGWQGNNAGAAVPNPLGQGSWGGLARQSPALVPQALANGATHNSTSPAAIQGSPWSNPGSTILQNALMAWQPYRGAHIPPNPLMGNHGMPGFNVAAMLAFQQGLRPPDFMRPQAPPIAVPPAAPAPATHSPDMGGQEGLQGFRPPAPPGPPQPSGVSALLAACLRPACDAAIAALGAAALPPAAASPAAAGPAATTAMTLAGPAGESPLPRRTTRESHPGSSAAGGAQQRSETERAQRQPSEDVTFVGEVQDAGIKAKAHVPRLPVAGTPGRTIGSGPGSAFSPVKGGAAPGGSVRGGSAPGGSRQGQGTGSTAGPPAPDRKRPASAAFNGEPGAKSERPSWAPNQEEPAVKSKRVRKARTPHDV